MKNKSISTPPFTPTTIERPPLAPDAWSNALLWSLQNAFALPPEAYRLPDGTSDPEDAEEAGNSPLKTTESGSSVPSPRT